MTAKEANRVIRAVRQMQDGQTWLAIRELRAFIEAAGYNAPPLSHAPPVDESNHDAVDLDTVYLVDAFHELAAARRALNSRELRPLEALDRVERALAIIDQVTE